MGNLNESTYEKSITTSKEDKIERKHQMLGQIEKATRFDTESGLNNTDTGTFQNNERKFNQKVGGKCAKTYQMRGKQNDFGATYGNGEIITKKPNG